MNREIVFPENIGEEKTMTEVWVICCSPWAEKVLGGQFYMTREDAEAAYERIEGMHEHWRIRRATIEVMATE